MSKLHKGKSISEEHKESLRVGREKMLADPVRFGKFKLKMSTVAKDPEVNKKRSLSLKKLSSDETHIKKVSDGVKRHYQSSRGDDHRKSTSEKIKLRWEDPKYRNKMKQGVEKYWKSLSDEEYDAVCARKSEQWTDEMRKAASIKSKENAKETHKPVECEHCKKKISRQNYAQFHGEKCFKITGVRLERPRVNCIYCGKSCTHSTINRWHNENCKYRI